MKVKLLLVFLLVFAFSFNANSQINLIENFDYPAGDSIGAHGWTGFSSFVNVITVTSPGLTYSGYSGSGIGNAIKLRNNGQDAYRDLNFVDSVGSVYVSFMLNVDSAKTNGDYFFALLPINSTTLYTARVYVKDSNNAFKIGLIKATTTGGALFYSADTYQYATTYLVVLKYVFNTGSTTDDVMSLFVFASPTLPATEPTTPTVGPVTGTQNDMTNLGRIAVRQGSSSNAPTVFFDGVKVAKTWTNIVANVKNVSTVAESFSLSQNYPNPFNPNTTISFSIPTNGFVNLKVFNMLGQEVSSLVTSQLTAGTYNVDFNGSKLTSGVYYYKLNYIDVNGKEFSDVKKLMLVK